MHQLDFLLATLICVKSNFRPNIKWPSYHTPIAFGFTNNRKFSIINMLSIYQLSYSTLHLVSSSVNDVTIIKIQTQPCALTFTSENNSLNLIADHIINCLLSISTIKCKSIGYQLFRLRLHDLCNQDSQILYFSIFAILFVHFSYLIVGSRRIYFGFFISAFFSIQLSVFKEQSRSLIKIIYLYEVFSSSMFTVSLNDDLNKKRFI